MSLSVARVAAVYIKVNPQHHCYAKSKKLLKALQALPHLLIHQVMTKEMTIF
jgi:hypothetical protein